MTSGRGRIPDGDRRTRTVQIGQWIGQLCRPSQDGLFSIRGLERLEKPLSSQGTRDRQLTREGKKPPEDRWLDLRLSLIVLTPFLFLWLFGVAKGWPPNWPSGGSVAFLNVHYIGAILIALIAQIFILAFTGRRSSFAMVALAPMFIIALLLHFNFKAWIPFANPRLFDDTYYRLDLMLQPLVDGCSGVRTWLASNAPISTFWFDRIYHLGFIAMFYLVTAGAGILDSAAAQRRLILGLTLILLVGGVTYWIAPALGPFIFRGGGNAVAERATHSMYEAYLQVRESRQFPPGYFAAPLAAMPSLHVGHTAFMTAFAWARRPLRSLAWILTPLAAFITIEAIASGWHYLVDLPAGLLLAALVWWAVGKMAPEEEDASAPIERTTHGELGPPEGPPTPSAE